MDGPSEYIEFDDALSLYGLPLNTLLNLIESIVYARPLRPAPDGQPRLEIHRESLQNALEIDQVKRKWGAGNSTPRKLELQAAAGRTRLALADGQPVTELQLAVLRAQDKAAEDY